MLAGTLLAIDMGATPLGNAIAATAGDPEWVGWYGGLLLGAMFGVNWVFNIPVGLGIIEVEDRKYLALGTLAGIIVAPLVCWFLVSSRATPSWNACSTSSPCSSSPSWLLSAGHRSRGHDQGFPGLRSLNHLRDLDRPRCAIFSQQTGVTIIPGMEPLFTYAVDGGTAMQGLEVVGAIAITLAGAYPLVKFLTPRWAARWVLWARAWA
jgi:ethanolamine transporter